MKLSILLLGISAAPAILAAAIPPTNNAGIDDSTSGLSQDRPVYVVTCQNRNFFDPYSGANSLHCGFRCGCKGNRLKSNEWMGWAIVNVKLGGTTVYLGKDSHPF
ncbi:hypothetical protein ABW19_dt0201035 [Dactylella cylindrospora]|nr:hypothetical protein ABW19_dt0201035 [Dactylella cylindrospora]